MISMNEPRHLRQITLSFASNYLVICVKSRANQHQVVRQSASISNVFCVKMRHNFSFPVLQFFSFGLYSSVFSFFISLFPVFKSPFFSDVF